MGIQRLDSHCWRRLWLRDGCAGRRGIGQGGQACFVNSTRPALLCHAFDIRCPPLGSHQIRNLVHHITLLLPNLPSSNHASARFLKKGVGTMVTGRPLLICAFFLCYTRESRLENPDSLSLSLSLSAHEPAALYDSLAISHGT